MNEVKWWLTVTGWIAATVLAIILCIVGNSCNKKAATGQTSVPQIVKVQDTIIKLVKVQGPAVRINRTTHDTIHIDHFQTVYDTIRGEDCVVYQKDSFPNDSTDNRVTSIKNNRPVTYRNALKFYIGAMAGTNFKVGTICPLVGFSTDNRHQVLIDYDLINRVGSVGIVWRLGK